VRKAQNRHYSRVCTTWLHRGRSAGRARYNHGPSRFSDFADIARPLTLRTPACSHLRRLRALLASVPLAACCVAGCQREPLPPPAREDKLVIAIRPGPTTWFPGPDGEPAGFDHDLVAQFARERNLKLEVITLESASDLLAKVASGAVHIAAGGLYRPPAAGPGEVRTGADPRVLWTSGYYAVEPVLIYTTDDFRPKDWRDLAGAAVGYAEETGAESSLARIRAAHPDVVWKSMAVPSAEALIAQVSDGTIDYAIVPSVDAAASRNIFLDYDVAFPVDVKRDLAWAVAPGQEKLRDDLDAFFAKSRRDGLLARLIERYYSSTRQVQRIDAAVFQERIRTVLPEYRGLFQRAQVATGVDWRLLAAIAYQESQWDPFATSETGVRGLMQITEDTAKHLGVGDRLDPWGAVLGAAQYVQDLKGKMSPRIVEPDRTWLALAAFNIGLAHLEDARVLTQRQKLNPDLWSDVKKTLPLLALPEYYSEAKFGYARGGMPVAFVDRVRAYYDVLIRQQPAYQPRLRAFPFAVSQ
jgi:membrane-bound lytic murein transglycosylase F